MTVDPSNQPVSAVAIGQNLPYIRWALGHADQVADLIQDLQDIATAVGIDAKWAAIKAAGDLVVGILGDFPRSPDSGRLLLHGFTGEVCTEEQALELSQSLGGRFDGTFLKLLLANLPAIMEFISQIIPLFGSGDQVKTLGLE